MFRPVVLALGVLDLVRCLTRPLSLSLCLDPVGQRAVHSTRRYTHWPPSSLATRLAQCFGHGGGGGETLAPSPAASREGRCCKTCREDTAFPCMRQLNHTRKAVFGGHAQRAVAMAGMRFILFVVHFSFLDTGKHTWGSFSARQFIGRVIGLEWKTSSSVLLALTLGDIASTSASLARVTYCGTTPN